ncbi:MAG: NAD(P)H-hydrate dehydratase [Promethearchaeota archaeon]
MQEIPLSTDEMRVLELNAEYLGVTHGMLMQNAGREVARIISTREKVKDKLVVILCGMGGNGGDGIVAARYLHEDGARVEVYLLGSPKNIANPDTKVNWKILQNLHEIASSLLKTESEVRRCNSIGKADVLIDAMMGFGLKSKLREPMLTAAKAFNKSNASKYAIDVPSGIDSDTGEIYDVSVKAEHTIALHAPKKGAIVASDASGKLHIVSIGIPAETDRICGPGDVRLLTPPRAKSTHKGDYGKILIVGGSDVFSGAPALTGMAALRTGADLVSILAPEPVVPAIRSYSPNLMVQSLGTRILTPDSNDSIIKAAKGQDVVAIGPGLGLAPETSASVRAIVGKLAEKKKSMVIDADGLKALAGSGLSLDPSNAILTPHWGELGVLLEEKLGESKEPENRLRCALSAASKFNSIVLLKGAIDIVAHPDGRYKLNRTGVPAMSAGGTGDVLTGIIAALIVRGKGAFTTAAASAFISGRAGEAAFRQKGDHIVATDCIDQIPDAMQWKA